MFTCKFLHVSRLLSQSAPSSPSPTSHKCSLCLPIYCCPPNRFIHSIFHRFHIYAIIYDICLSIFFFRSTTLLLPTHLPPPWCTNAQSCNPMDFSLPDSSVHGLEFFPGKNTGVGCHFLLLVFLFLTYLTLYNRQSPVLNHQAMVPF